MIWLPFYLDWIPSTSKLFRISEMWNIWIHSIEASIFSKICIEDYPVFSRHLHSYAIIRETLGRMKVEDKQKLCSFKSHNFISLMFPAYIPLKTIKCYHIFGQSQINNYTSVTESSLANRCMNLRQKYNVSKTFSVSIITKWRHFWCWRNIIYNLPIHI